MSYLLGLDIGTSQLAAVAWDTNKHSLLALEQAPNTSVLHHPDADVAEQDAEALIAAGMSLLTNLARRPELRRRQPLALGITGQMHGVVLSDACGRAKSPLITWQDGRGSRMLPGGTHSWLAEFTSLFGEQQLAATGCHPATGYGGITLLRMAKEKGVPPHTVALTIQALFVRRLGGAAIMDPTDAASWGIFDVQHGMRWLQDVIRILNIPAQLLPDLAASGSQAGRLNSSVARQLGLPAGLPLAVSLGDNQAAFLGSLAGLNGVAHLNLGTGGQISLVADEFKRMGEMETRPLVQGKYLLVGASLCGGRAYALLRNFFEDVGRQLFSGAPSQDLYMRMNILAATAARDCGGMVAKTGFAGTRSNASARAHLSGISADNFTPANLTRAIIQGMVAELGDYYDQAQAAGWKLNRLTGSGNALRCNPVACQEAESRFGTALRLSPHKEEAAVGAALAAGVAAGVYADWTSALRGSG